MGKIKRLANIFQEDGNAIVTAMDHGCNSGPMAGIESAAATLQKVIDAGTDGVLVNIGILKKYESILARTGVIVRCDFPCTDYITNSRDSELSVTVEEAVRAGADAVIFNGGPNPAGDVSLERGFMKICGALRRECDIYGMPLIAEVVPGGFNAPECVNLESLKIGARIAAEWGADALKMAYRPGYEEVVDGCEGLPILVLGGAKTKSDYDFLANIEGAMKAGAHGVAIGRNIWGNAHPDRFIATLKGLVHEGLSLDEAYKRMED